jgi:hypothetical protein
MNDKHRRLLNSMPNTTDALTDADIWHMWNSIDHNVGATRPILFARALLAAFQSSPPAAALIDQIVEAALKHLRPFSSDSAKAALRNSIKRILTAPAPADERAAFVKALRARGADIELLDSILIDDILAAARAAQRLYEYEVTPEKEAARNALDDIRNGKYQWRDTGPLETGE